MQRGAPDLSPSQMSGMTKYLRNYSHYTCGGIYYFDEAERARIKQKALNGDS
jgi:hypothetical protein